MTFTQEETRVLNAMARATPDEQRVLAEHLERIRTAHRASQRAAADLDVSEAVIRDHLTPVATHGFNTAATDWFSEIAVEATYDPDIDLAIRAEASRWFTRTSAEVRADPDEFFEQAQGMARRTAGTVGDVSGEVERTFLEHACHLAGIRLAVEDPDSEESKWPTGDSPDAGSLNWPITSTEPATTGDTQDWGLVPNATGSLRRQAEDAYDKGKTNNDPPGWYYIDSKGADTGPFSDEEKEDMDKSRTKGADYHWFKKGSKTGSPQPGDADDSGQGTSKLPMEVLPSDNDTTMDNFAPDVAPDNTGITPEDTSSMRAPVIEQNKQDAPESGGSSGNAGEQADPSGQGVSKLPQPNDQTPAYSSLSFGVGGTYVGADGRTFVCVAVNNGTYEWEPTGVIDLSRGQVTPSVIHRHAAQVFAGGGLDNLGDDRAKEFGKDDDDEDDEKKESARKLAEGQKCKKCGAPIERDPEGEDNRTWHHADGDKHDHEAEPSGDTSDSDGDSDSDSDDSGGKPWEKKSSLRRLSYWYCPTHDVAVGDKNRDTHAGCKLVERKTKDSGRKVAVDSHTDFPEGTTAECVQCGEPILLDQREGGGPGKDWGSPPGDWVGNGGIGMDYGCAESALNDDQGTGGHIPKRGTIKPPGKESARRYASEPMADPSGQGVSDLPTPEDNDDTMWDWELDDSGKQREKGAADVAGVPTPGGSKGYPQTSSMHGQAARQRMFRERVQRNLRGS